MRAQTRRRMIRVLAVLLAIVGYVIFAIAYTSHKDRVWSEEKYAFVELKRLALQLVVEKGPGVAGERNEAFITSFDAFYDYVAKQRPEIVGARDAGNPFPGLLPPGQYGRLATPAKSKDDLLFWSQKIHHRANWDSQCRITCGGLLKAMKRDL